MRCCAGSRQRAVPGQKQGGDVGMMYKIGTLVDIDRVGTLPYTANGFVPEGLLQHMVVSLSRIGRHCFPQVYAVIRDLESYSGLLPMPLMNGEFSSQFRRGHYRSEAKTC